MIVAIHQPQFMPWIGYIDKIDRADIFVYLDNVQFRKNEFQNRNKIKTCNGWQWLTAPVTYRFPQRINEVRLNNTINWKKKHLMTIETNYRKSPYFDDIFPMIQDLYSIEYEYLYKLNIDCIGMILRFLNIDKETIRASEIDGLREEPSLRLIDICKHLNADTYLAGGAGKGYMDLSAFKAHGIEVIFQDFNHPVYPQLYGEFLPFMSCLDLLFNCGYEAIDIIRGSRCC